LEATEGAAEPAAHPVLRRAGVWAEPEGLAAWVLMRLCWATVRRAALAEPEDWAALAAMPARAPIQPMAATAGQVDLAAWRATEPQEPMGRMARI
jgi:hypothetical protein